MSYQFLFYQTHVEELIHSHLFPTSKFDYKFQGKVKSSPVKYFNQCFLNYKQKWSSDFDYIFLAHSVKKKLNLSSRINRAMKKVKNNQLTAGILSKYFNESIKSFVANDEAFSFMNTVIGTYTGKYFSLRFWPWLNSLIYELFYDFMC